MRYCYSNTGNRVWRTRKHRWKAPNLHRGQPPPLPKLYLPNSPCERPTAGHLHSQSVQNFSKRTNKTRTPPHRSTDPLRMRGTQTTSLKANRPFKHNNHGLEMHWLNKKTYKTDTGDLTLNSMVVQLKKKLGVRTISAEGPFGSDLRLLIPVLC